MPKNNFGTSFELREQVTHTAGQNGLGDMDQKPARSDSIYFLCM